MKKITLAMVCLLTLMAIVSLTGCGDNDNGQLADLQSEENSELRQQYVAPQQDQTATPEQDIFENVPILEEGQDFLTMYLSNTELITEEQFNFIVENWPERYSWEPVRAKSGEVYVQYVSENEESMYLYVSTSAGRARLFKTADNDWAIIGVDEDGKLRWYTSFETPYPKWVIYGTNYNSPVHYRTEQIEGAEETVSNYRKGGVNYFFPDEQVERRFFLTNMEEEFNYSFVGEIVGKVGNFYLTQDEDKVYVNTVGWNLNHAESGCEWYENHLLTEGVEKVEISDNVAQLYMLNGTIKNCSYVEENEWWTKFEIIAE